MTRDYRWAVAGAVVVIGIVIAAIASFALTGMIVGIVIFGSAVLFIPRKAILGVVIALEVFIASVAPGVANGVTVGQLALTGASALVLVIGLIRARQRLRWRTIVTVTAILYGLYLLVSLVSEFANWFYVGAAVLAIPLTLAASSMTRNDRAILLVSLVAVAGANSILAIYETFVAKAAVFAPARAGLSPHAFISDGFRAQVLAGHPLVLGSLVLVGFLIAISMRGRRWLRLCVSLIMVGGMIATGSASIIAAAILGSLFVVAQKSTMGGRLFLLVFGTLGIALLSMTSQLPAAAGALFGGNAQRLSSAVAIPNIVEGQPLAYSLFGGGWGSTGRLYEWGLIAQSRSASIDNEFVTTLGEVGVVGLLALLVLFVVVLRTIDHETAVVWVGIAALFLSFDVLSWVLPAGLFFIFSAIPRNMPKSLESRADPESRDHIAGRILPSIEARMRRQ